MEKRSSSSKPRVCANPHCQRKNIRAYSRCQPCYRYFRRHGRDITSAEMSPLRRRSEERCRNCNKRPRYARNRCRRCYQFWLRTGRERPSEGQKGKDGLCRNCGLRPPYRSGRCRSCYAYLRMHRKDRQDI